MTPYPGLRSFFSCAYCISIILCRWPFFFFFPSYFLSLCSLESEKKKKKKNTAFSGSECHVHYVVDSVSWVFVAMVERSEAE